MSARRYQSQKRNLILFAGAAIVLIVAAGAGLRGAEPEAPTTAGNVGSFSAYAKTEKRQMPDGATVILGPRLRPTGDGFLVVTGTGRVVGSKAAPLVRYTLEVEPELRDYASDLKAVAGSALLDEERGWTSQGDRQLQRVADPANAQIRVVLASPGVVDRHCARIGLMTNGTFSCWDGSRAMLNLTRWQEGASDFGSLHGYRHYLINHEFGHGLGLGHESCQTTSTPAPVMMQQTKGTEQCTANGWPYPQALSAN
jgi:hypothetical protein